MAQAPSKKATLISVRELPKVVELAVKAAHARLASRSPARSGRNGKFTAM